MHTVCVDFGTSSIRAGLLQKGSITPRSLAIAPTSQIDNASIPSAIFISKDGRKLLFGERALEAGLASNPHLIFEISPKSWLSPASLANLSQPASNDLPFTRRQLISGLLAFAVDRCSRELESKYSIDPKACTFRISHPVWEKDYRRLAMDVYESLRRTACFDSKVRVREEMSAKSFSEWCDSINQVPLLPEAGIDVEEPVAVALTIISDPIDNARTMALIIDVGAGTIDLGLFLSTMPDEFSWVKPKLIPIASPRSLYGAGDEIDKTLISFFERQFSAKDDSAIAALRNDIRRSKERLFDSGSLVIGNRKVSVDEFVKTERLRKMALDLKAAINGMLSEAAERLETQLSSSLHPIRHIDVVFAGGGANLNFLREVVNKLIKLGNKKFITVQSSPKTPIGFEVEATMARMAVALGGTTPSAMWPDTQMKEPKFRRGLSTSFLGLKAKQK
jgi:hypothetical protein